MVKNKKIVVFGASGRVGRDLARLLARENQVLGVARFSRPEIRQALEAEGVQTLPMDVTDDDLSRLPDQADFVFNEIALMHGAQEDPAAAYATNTYFVGRLMERFPEAAGIVQASSGNVYGFPGKLVSEEALEAPVGVYALSRFAGEQMVRYFAQKNRTPAVILRYFYGNSETYGVLYKLAHHILRGEEIPLQFGSEINCIAHEDLVRFTALSAEHCTLPPLVMNVTSPQPYPVRELVRHLARALGVEDVRYADTPERQRLTLAAVTPRQNERLGRPEVGLQELIERVAAAVLREVRSEP